MKFLYKISILFSLLWVCHLEAKVNIFAHYFGQPEFVKYQHAFFKKNMLDEYEFVIFEDSNDPAISEQIKRECETYGVTYVHIPQAVFKKPKLPVVSSYVDPYAPSFGCAVATQYIYDNYVITSKDVCLILDNDIFLLSPFSVQKYLGSKAFAYSQELRFNESSYVDYMLPNFVIFNPVLMPENETVNFNLGTILGNNTDSGGFTYFYLQKYRSLGRRFPKHYFFETSSKLKERYLSLCPLLFTSQEWSSHCFIERDLFLHIRMGSNWSRHAHYRQIREEIETLFDTLLNH
jgi:hypothetical protein